MPDIVEGIPFVKPPKVVEITSEGGKYIDASLGFCMSVPKDAIFRNTKLHLLVGMSLYGSFLFPKKTMPISPILLLHPLSGVKLQRRITISVPHILMDVHDKEIPSLGIKIAKANLIKSKADLSKSSQNVFTFSSVEEDCNIRLFIENDKSYIAFDLNHFCFLAARANNDENVVKRKGYCLFPSACLNTPRHLKYFIGLTYFISPCLEVRLSVYIFPFNFALCTQAFREQLAALGYEANKSEIKVFKMNERIQAKIKNVSELYILMDGKSLFTVLIRMGSK